MNIYNEEDELFLAITHDALPFLRQWFQPIVMMFYFLYFLGFCAGSGTRLPLLLNMDIDEVNNIKLILFFLRMIDLFGNHIPSFGESDWYSNILHTNPSILLLPKQAGLVVVNDGPWMYIEWNQLFHLSHNLLLLLLLWVLKSRNEIGNFRLKKKKWV